MPNYLLVDNSQKLDAMVNSIASSCSILALDIETTSLAPRHGKIRLVQVNDSKNTYIIDCKAFNYDYDKLSKFWQLIFDKKTKLIIHNRNFEHQWFLYHLGRHTRTVFDTQIASTLVEFQGRHSLSAISQKYLNINLDKTEQKSDWSGELTESQLDYAADDVVHLHELREILLKKLQESSQLGAAQLEFDVTPVVASMELNGMPINKAKYQALVEKNRAIRDEKYKFLLEYLQTRGGSRPLPKKLYQEDIFGNVVDVKTSNDLNVGSWQQVLPILQEMGIPITTTNEKDISPLASEYPAINYLLDYRGYDKLCNTYGDSFLNAIENNTLYTGYNQFGTVTARFSGRTPNLLTIPKDKEYRDCFEVGDGEVFFSHDFSQMELRILASFSNDRVMMDAYNTGKDLHSVTAANIFNLPYERVKQDYPKERDDSKTLNFFTVYGGGVYALVMKLKAKGVDATEDYAKKLIDGFYQSYPQAARWLFAQERKVMQDPIMRSVAGHAMKVVYDKNDKTSVAGAKRDARNWRIQSGNSCVTKRAMTNLYWDVVENKRSIKIRNVVHDELNTTCDYEDKDESNDLIQRYMEEAGNYYFPNIKIVAEGKPGKSWADK